MSKKKKQQFQKMVLVPYVPVQESRIEYAGENDFSRHTDTPFMKHLKNEMKEILNNPSLEHREKLRLYNHILQKYRLLKDEQVDTLQKPQNDTKRLQGVETDFIIDEPSENQAFTWDDYELHPGEQSNVNQIHEIPYGEMEMPDQSDIDDVSMHSAPMHRISKLNAGIRQKRNFHVTDSQLELYPGAKHPRVMKQRRRNAVDSPPNKLIQFRKTVGRPSTEKKKTEPGEYTIIDHRFKKATRKRPSAKLASGKKSWLGRRKSYSIPPSQKQMRFNEDEDEDGEGQWSELS